MNDKITTYYIPNNPKIESGQIYTLYVNNNTNLDLSQIIKESANKILLSNEEYIKLLNTSNQIQTIINKKTDDINKYIKEEKNIIESLNKLNIDYKNMLIKIKEEIK